MSVSVTRRYRFSASHRLHLDSLTPEQNRELYGKCNYPYGHGHNYVLEVTLTGPVDRSTGLIVPLVRLDRLVENNVLSRFAGRNINLDIPEFSRKIPTTENIAAVITHLLQENWTPAMPPARLRRVHVQETDRNGFEILLPVLADIEREQAIAHA